MTSMFARKRLLAVASGVNPLLDVASPSVAPVTPVSGEAAGVVAP